MRNVNVNSIGEYIREQREQAKISMRQLAQSAGVSNPYLSQIERGLRKPSADILQQIAKGLRISAEALYVQAGILEDRPADSGVRSALLADPQLSERQKQVLIEIYESFRRENAATTQTAADADDPGAPAELTGGEPGAEAEVLEAAAMEAAAMEAMQAEAAEATQAEATRVKAPRTKAGRAKAMWAEATQAEAGAEPAQAPDPQEGSSIKPHKTAD
jgi:transcriptional regulator with XRE-family HTH domain